MKIDNDNDQIIIYLKKELIGSVDFTDADCLEDYLKELIIKLKNIYNISIKGFYNIKVYIDDTYGAILELKAVDLDYGDYFEQIEMRIIPIYTNFLYKIDDYISGYGKIYSYKNNIYLKLKDNISYKDYLKVMDYAKIVYTNTDNILNFGTELSF